MRAEESPDLVMAKRLLDELKLRGFAFRRSGLGVDAPLVGNRISGDSVDLVHVEGFSGDCVARRQRTSSLIVPGSALVERQVAGSALEVLYEVLSWDTES